MTVTIEDVAKACACSTATVSRVLNQRGTVKAETRDRVLETVRQLGFKPKYSARKDSIAVAVEQVAQFSQGGYSGMLLAALAEAIAATGQRLEILPADHLELSHEKFHSGLISCLYSPSSLQRLRDTRAALPTVTINETIAGVASVCSDEAHAIDGAVGTLWQLGHRHIGLLGKASQTASSKERNLAFGQSLQQRGVDQTDTWIDCDLHPTAALARLRAQGATAIIACGEERNLAVLRACHELRLRVPDDLSLICYENKHVSNQAIPRLSTLAQDFPALAQAAIKAIASPATTTPIKQRIPLRFIERESIAAPRI